MVRRRVSLTGMSIGSSNIANNNDNNRKQRRRKSAAAADNVLAGTAGLDNWKTWAGRQHGGDEFEFLDLFRGMKRTITHKFLTGPPPPGTTCPVCFCEPDEWHVTSSCFHAVCIDCFKAYASNQVKDVQQSGPLKCPVCPQVLRRSDAIAALGGDRELIRQWDLKIRNQLLRALPAFRSCPHCSNNNNTTTATATSFETNNHTTNSAAEITDYGSDDNSSTNDSSNNNGNGGGGFVTPECLGPHYQERRDIATKILYALPLVTIALFLFWIFLVVAIAKTPSSSAMIDLLFMLLPLYSIVRAGRVAHGWVAQAARKAHFKPITVECPCCDKAFILPAESKELHDEETSRWMNAHTRPCPSCSVPIHKDGGCNHMRCGHCHANFCWACMRLRTDCAAYACRNGAQYGNALPVPGVNGNGNNGNGRAPILGADSILSIIDYILDRPRPTLDWKVDGLLLGYAVLIRHFGPLQQFVEYIMAFISTLFTSGIVTTGVALYVSKLTCERLRLEMANRAAIRAAQQELQQQQQQPLPPPQIQRRRNNNHNILFNDNHNATASELLLGIDARNARQRQRNVNIMTEREMIAEATRRSMVER